MAESPLYRFARQGQGAATVEDIEFGGVLRIWAASALPELGETGLRVLVGVSKTDLLAAANRNLHQAMVTLAVVLLLVFIGAWVLVELVIRRQVARIMAAVKRFSGGNFNTRIGKPYPRGEIGILMAAMDNAFGLMHAQRDVIHGLNTNLERRVAERTAQLEAANKELEAFSYSVSHDLRAPLRSIDGFSQAVLEDYADKLDQEGREHLHRVRASSQRMGELIDNLLSLSGVTRRDLRLETVNLSELARNIAAELQQSQPERQVTFAIAEGLQATADGGLMRVVLENLIGNAWKFSGKRADAKIEFGVVQDNGSPAYFLRDDGAGFDMAHADKLFGAFQRLHGTAEFPGTGIGLATVQRVIHRHGGKVRAEGKVNEGATFYFTLSD
jgi:signal transduction histidine kinase